MIKTFLNNKKLKKYSALELVPVALVSFEKTDDGKINLIVPRFTKKWLQNIFTGKQKSATFKVKLDEIGSAIWQIIDNESNIELIIHKVENTDSTEKIILENAEQRILAFITDLYRKDLITFKQLQ